MWLSLLNDVLACLLALPALRAWRAHMLGVLGMLTCLACFMKLRAWRASKNRRACLLHKMTCLKLMKVFLDVFDQEALVNGGLC